MGLAGNIHYLNEGCSTKINVNFQIPADGKLRTVAKQMYGAKDIELSPKAMEKLALYTKQVRSFFLQKKVYIIPSRVLHLYMVNALNTNRIVFLALCCQQQSVYEVR